MPTPPRPVDATLHGVVDYTAGAFLMTAFPKVAGIEGTRSGQPDPAGRRDPRRLQHADRLPARVVAKALPFQAHLVRDAVGAVALAATPFVTGQFLKGRRHWIPHVALGLFELASLALTDPTGRGDFHGDVESVREANMEDPHGKDLQRRACGGPGLTQPSPFQPRSGPECPPPVGAWHRCRNANFTAVAETRRVALASSGPTDTNQARVEPRP